MEIEHIICRTKALLDGVEAHLNPLELIELKKINFVLDYVAFMLDYNRGKAALRSSRWKVDIIAPMFDCLDSKKLSKQFHAFNNPTVNSVYIHDRAMIDVNGSIYEFFRVIENAANSPSDVYSYVENNFRFINFNRLNIDFFVEEYAKNLKMYFSPLFLQPHITNKIMVVGLNFSCRVSSLNSDFTSSGRTDSIHQLNNYFNLVLGALTYAIKDQFSHSYRFCSIDPYVCATGLFKGDVYVFLEASEENLHLIYQCIEKHLVNCLRQQTCHGFTLIDIDIVRLNNTTSNYLGGIEIDELEEFISVRTLPILLFKSLTKFCLFICSYQPFAITYPSYDQSNVSVFHDSSVKTIQQIRNLRLLNYLSYLEEIYSAFDAVLIPSNSMFRKDLDIMILINLVCFFFSVIDLKNENIEKVFQKLILTLTNRMFFDNQTALYPKFVSSFQNYISSTEKLISPQAFFLHFVVMKCFSLKSIGGYSTPSYEIFFPINVTLDLQKTFLDCLNGSVKENVFNLAKCHDFFRDSYTQEFLSSSFEVFFNYRQKINRASVNRWTKYLNDALIKDRIFVEVAFGVSWAGSIRNSDEIINDSFHVLRKMLNKAGHNTISAHFGFCDTITSGYFKSSGSAVFDAINPYALINFKFLLILIDVSNLNDLTQKFETAFQAVKTKTKLDFGFSCQYPYACVITKKLMPSLRAKITNYVTVGAHINDFSPFLMSYKGRKIILGHPKGKAKTKTKMQN